MIESDWEKTEWDIQVAASTISNWDKTEWDIQVAVKLAAAEAAYIESVRLHNLTLDELRDTAALLDAAELDAARYRWLRHGDNDEVIIAYADDADPHSWLPRNKELDAAIDAAMKGKP